MLAPSLERVGEGGIEDTLFLYFLQGLLTNYCDGAHSVESVFDAQGE